MGWFVGMAFLPLLYKHSEYLSEHNWMPYVILSAFALAGGIIILCLQKVNYFYIGNILTYPCRLDFMLPLDKRLFLLVTLFLW